MPYSYDDLKNAYQRIGVRKGDVVLLKTDLRTLGPFERPGRSEVLEAHFNALADVVDLGVGTIVVPTSSTALCNTDIPYDPVNTPGNRGVLTEYIRNIPESVRSHHAFFSHAAIGAHAEVICRNVSRHCYGPETPKARMLELDAVYVTLGIEPRWVCAYVHHMEMQMGVPYRYTKEFVQPVVQPDGSIEDELFYIFVYYLDMELSRNLNVNLFNFLAENDYVIDKAAVGSDFMYRCDCNEFCRLTARYFRNDIYGWLNQPPTRRPYRT